MSAVGSRLAAALAIALLAALVAAPAKSQPAAAAPTAEEIIAAADLVRNPDKAFRLTSTLIEYVGGKPRDRVVLVIFAREDKATRQFSNLARYAEPLRDTGKMALLNAPNLWFYDPASKTSIRISPQQRLIGQASDADVLTVNLARDYRGVILGEETLQDADRKDRLCWHLDMTAATADAIYSRMEYWVERGTYRAVKAKFYSDSGRLLKIAYFRKYQEQLGQLRPTETIIIDAVDANLVTTINSTDYRFQDIPDTWFQRDFLPRLKVD
ncbi:MAG: outer membrane lipoprotein-sorting protein [Proteobacteria bacterium]|nr:outer membrane lipoprotein-sorting protein [Pseudomonadota bacterium]MBI3497631.1 outer membrane lipoprotein-sorting protein [Pseudomonadota bacterium]